ncbi:hypothetical protein MMC30_001976 [Trapelia coarctata]|nr:hypothetical protein [Trapelia coarctata]
MLSTETISVNNTLANAPTPAASFESALAKSAQISFGRSPQCTVSWDSYIAKLGGSFVTKITTVQEETALTTGTDAFFIPYVGDLKTLITKTGVFQVTNTITETVPVENASSAAYHVGEDGFTYKSPYAYVVFPTIYAADSCGPLGATHRDLTLSFAPGELSTVEGRLGPVKSFNFADLPCPPMSVAKADWYNFHPMDGRTYAPIIAPAPQLYTLDPLWSTCYVDIYEGYDPPYALTPATALAQTTDPAPIAKPTDAQPQEQATRGAVQTQSSKMFNPQTVSAAAPSHDPPLPKASEALPSQDPTVKPPDNPLSSIQLLSTGAPKADDPPAQDPSSQAVPPQDYRTANPPVATPILPSFATLTRISQIPAPMDPGVIAGTQTRTGGTVAAPIVIAGQTARFESSALVIGSQTLNAGVATIAGTPVSLPAGGSAIVIAGTTVPLSIEPAPPKAMYQLGTNTLTIDSTGGYVVDGHTLLPGQPAVTVSGTIISLGPSSLVLGTQTYALPTPSRDLLTPGAVITAAGQTFMPNPTGFAVAGTTLREGGPAITVSGTPISLGPSGLVIGTSGTSLPFMITSPSPSKFTTDGVTFDAASTGFVVNGVETLLPGQAVTVGGTVVSLTPGESILVIGSDAIPLRETTTMGLGGLIISPFGPPGSPASPTATATTTYANGTVLTFFAGKGSRAGVVWWKMGVVVMGVVLWVSF